jgi:replicative DNA helicase
MENKYLKTGYDEIDSFTGGYKRGELTALTSCVDVVSIMSSLILAFKAIEEGNGPIALFSTDLDYKTLINVISDPNKSSLVEGPSLEEVKKGFSPNKDKIYVFTKEGDLPSISSMVLALRQCKPSFSLIFISSLDAINEVPSSLTRDEDKQGSNILKSLHSLAKEGNYALVVGVHFSCNEKRRKEGSLLIEQVREMALLERNVNLVLSVYDKKACQAVSEGIAKPLEMLSTQLLLSSEKESHAYLKEIKILVWRKESQETKELNFGA